jgi:hypothetical protein
MSILFSVLNILIIQNTFKPENELDLSLKIKYEIMMDEIGTYGYDYVIEKNNQQKTIQEQHKKYLSFIKAKQDKKDSVQRLKLNHILYGKRINFAKSVYNIIISKNKHTFYVKQCDCVYCIFNNPNAGERRTLKFFVSTIGKEHNILQIALEGASYSEFDMITESSIPKKAKTLGFVQIIINSFSDDNNFSIKL